MALVNQQIIEAVLCCFVVEAFPLLLDGAESEKRATSTGERADSADSGSGETMRLANRKKKTRMPGKSSGKCLDDVESFINLERAAPSSCHLLRG